MLCADREQKNLTAETDRVQVSVTVCGKKDQFLLLWQTTLFDSSLDYLAPPKFRKRQEMSNFFTEKELQHEGKENDSGYELKLLREKKLKMLSVIHPVLIP